MALALAPELEVLLDHTPLRQREASLMVLCVWPTIYDRLRYTTPQVPFDPYPFPDVALVQWAGNLHEKPLPGN